MSHDLKEGVRLRSVITLPYQDGSAIYSARPGGNYREIVVSEQPGQMGMVPWARALHRDGRVLLINLANVESVELETEEGDTP